MAVILHLLTEIWQTISQLAIKQKKGELDFELEVLHSSIITIGSFDIADRFQAYLEQRLESAIILAEGEPMENILNEITQVEWSRMVFMLCLGSL